MGLTEWLRAKALNKSGSDAALAGDSSNGDKSFSSQVKVDNEDATSSSHEAAGSATVQQRRDFLPNSFAEQVISTSLSQVGQLIQKLVEMRVGTPTAPPAHYLQRALGLVAEDSFIAYVSVHVVSPLMDYALLVAAVGPSADAQLCAPSPAVGRLSVGSEEAGGTSSIERLISSRAENLTWRSSMPGASLPSDWEPLVSCRDNGEQVISCVPVRLGSRMLGVLTVATGGVPGGGHAADSAAGVAAAALASLNGVSVWPAYMNLVASSLCSSICDERLQLYLNLVRGMDDATDVSSMVQQALTTVREILGTQREGSVWYRLALTSGKSGTAVVFDDLTQVPRQLTVRRLADASEGSRLLREIQAHNGIMHTSVTVKNSIMLVAMNRRQQVVVPDVQKLINQSGVVCSDIFTTRLIKPPTSVLLVPIRLRDDVFGVVYCMSSVPTNFDVVTPALRELCDAVAPHMHTALTGTLATSWENLRTDVVLNQALSYSSWSAPTSEASSNGVEATRGESVTRSDGVSGSRLNSLSSEISESESANYYSQSRSATGALVTGLTEKLSNRRIKSTMDITKDNGLSELRLINLLGEGGFGKVFQGLWRGQNVGVKIVCDDGTVGRAVMKNAHEIAILSTISHPSIIQAYLCLTDISVREILDTCFRDAPQHLLDTTAFKYLLGQYKNECHVEIIEYCDRGNLANAIRDGVFFIPEAQPKPDPMINRVHANNPSARGASFAWDPNQDSMIVAARARFAAKNAALAAAGQLLPAAPVVPAAAAATDGSSGSGTSPSGGSGTSQPPPKRSTRIDMHAVLSTLLEIASGVAHLHCMGVVHCDLKPPNVLLKSSVSDERGFTAILTDFGLSRIQDNDDIASFPYNSCGTVAYVAPEAFNGTKRVNPSVDVYAFGIIMWEMYTCKRPYEGMRAQDVIQEVSMHNARPVFPRDTPPIYARLAMACWTTSRDERPSFEAICSALCMMLAECPKSSKLSTS